MMSIGRFRQHLKRPPRSRRPLHISTTSRPQKLRVYCSSITISPTRRIDDATSALRVLSDKIDDALGRQARFKLVDLGSRSSSWFATSRLHSSSLSTAISQVTVCRPQLLTEESRMRMYKQNDVIFITRTLKQGRCEVRRLVHIACQTLTTAPGQTIVKLENSRIGLSRSCRSRIARVLPCSKPS
jgi:hypothetical protein